jgi:hypothetical protein
MLDDFYDDDITNTSNNTIQENPPSVLNWGTGQRRIVPPSLPAFQSQQKKKSDINYDNILASMNLCVKDGKLHALDKSVTKNKETNYQAQFEQYKRQFSEVDSTLNDEDEGKRMTPEQYKMFMMRKQQLYKRAVWIENLKREAQRRRVNMVKSKKLLFSTGNVFQPNMNTASYNGKNKIFDFMGK